MPTLAVGRRRVLWPVPGLSYLYGHIDGGEHAVFPRLASAGNVERGAMIDGPADDGQAAAGVDRPTEGQERHGNVPRIVVHRHDDVEGDLDGARAAGSGGLRRGE